MLSAPEVRIARRPSCTIRPYPRGGSCMLQPIPALISTNLHIPTDFNTNFLMIARWIHFLPGITWIGLLYFFNLVNVPFQKELDAVTKGKVVPLLMPRALYWFRHAAIATVLAGLAYWGNVVGADARNGGGSAGNV